MRKRILTQILTVFLLTALLAGCQQAPLQQTQPQEKQSITIPAVTVDLQAPENQVQVGETEASTVYDAAGNALTDTQWLLNSKFAKSYIKSLGVGNYTFTYESATATGVIHLTITDNQPPKYVFTEEIPGTVNFLSSVTLPELVKEQGSYQDDYAVSYELKRGEEAVELTDGFVTSGLTEGTYTWTASALKDGVPYEFTQSFYVQSFAEYLETIEGSLLLDEQSGRYIAPQEKVYAVDTQSNNSDYFYTVNPEVLAVAMTAGVETVTITVTTDEPLVYGASGSIWISNSWNGYVFGVEGKTARTTDRSAVSEPTRYIGTVAVQDGKYIYQGTVFLDPDIFTESQPLSLQFNFAQCLADVKLEFQ